MAHVCAIPTPRGHSRVTARGTACAGEMNPGRTCHLLCPGCNASPEPRVPGAPAALGDTSQLPGNALHSDPGMLPADLAAAPAGNRKEATGHLLPSRQVRPGAVRELCLSAGRAGLGELLPVCHDCPRIPLQVVIVVPTTSLVLGEDLGVRAERAVGAHPRAVQVTPWEWSRSQARSVGTWSIGGASFPSCRL